MCSKARISAFPLLVFCSALAITISGCSPGGGNTAILSSNSATSVSGSDNGSPDGSGTSTSTAPTTLSWVAPLTYNDGVTRIAPGDLTSYRIYIYTDPGLTSRYADYLVPGPNPATSISLSDMNIAVFTDAASQRISTTYYLVVTAIATVDGIEIESLPSNAVSYVYP